jgi:hypothetical protein
LQDVPVKTISRIMKMLIPLRTVQAIGRLLNVSMAAVDRKQPSLALTVFVAGIGLPNEANRTRRFRLGPS